jgi:hypothetical protein
MAVPTEQEVYAIAEHLIGTDLTLFIADAWEDTLDLYKVPVDRANRPARWLAAHLATLSVRRVLSEQTSDLKVQYQAESVVNTGLDSTPYGQEFQRIVSRYNKDGGGLNLIVV